MSKRTINRKKEYGIPNNQLKKYKVTFYIWETNEELAGEMIEGALSRDIPAMKKRGQYDLDVELEEW